MDDFDDVGGYYADKGFFEKQNPTKAQKRQERLFDKWLDDEFFELDDWED